VNSLLIRNCSQLLTLRGDSLGIIRRGAVLTEGANIVAVGTERALMRRAKRAKEIDARGCVVMPGFVDSHSHPVFAASRVEEFERRIRGAKYDGSGILNSARKLRQTSETQLLKNLRGWATQFLRHGTTTLEAKSGYGLTLESELKMLRVIRKAGLVSTFLAHAKDGSRWEEMIPAAAKLAEFCDVFCDRVAFTVPESRRILMAAKRAGLKLKIHADQLSHTGGARLAAELGAVSADHLECATEADARALKKAGVVATLLPGVAFHVGTKYPPARMLIDAGVTVALATDFNPGTCPCLNMQLVIAIACSQLRMTPAEAIRAATINGARALCRGDRLGSLEAGKQADIIVLDVADYRELPYYFGVNHCRLVVKKGRLVT
jgi:imidazolonepropionase